MNRKLNNNSTCFERRPLTVPFRGEELNRDWIDSFPKNIPECIIHKILNLRPYSPSRRALKTRI